MTEPKFFSRSKSSGLWSSRRIERREIPNRGAEATLSGLSYRLTRRTITTYSHVVPLHLKPRHVKSRSHMSLVSIRTLMFVSVATMVVSVSDWQMSRKAERKLLWSLLNRA